MEAKLSRRERERDRRRTEILDAAGRVFVARGFAAATMDEVAAEAELSKGTLYLYFESKEALFLSLANQALDNVVAAYKAIAEAGQGNGSERLRQMMVAYSENALKNSEKFRVMVGRLASNSEMDTGDPTFAAHRERVDALVGYLVQSIELGRTDGSLRQELDPITTAGQVWGGLLGIVVVTLNLDELNRRFDKPIDRERLLPGYIDNFVNGLRPHSS